MIDEESWKETIKQNAVNFDLAVDAVMKAIIETLRIYTELGGEINGDNAVELKTRITFHLMGRIHEYEAILDTLLDEEA